MKKLIEGFTNLSIYKNYRERLMLLIDLLIVSFSFLLSIMFNISFNRVLIDGELLLKTLEFLLCVIVVYTILLMGFKINRSLWKYTSIIEGFKIGMVNLLAVVFISLIAYFLSYDIRLISVVFESVLFSVVFMIGARFIYRFYRRTVVLNTKTQKALIVGAGDAGVILLRELNQNPSIGYRIVGFLDDSKKGKIVCGINVVGNTEEIKQKAEELGADTILIAMPSAPKDVVRRIFDECKKVNLNVKIMRNLNDSLDDVVTRKQAIQDVKIEDLLGRGEIHMNQEEIKSYIENKVICVTGAAGSIGSELCRQIVRFKPRRLLMIDINENELYLLEQEFNRARMNHKMDEKIEIISYIASIREKAALDQIFDSEQPNVVYHAAAHKHVPLMETRPMEAVKNNVFGTYNLIRSVIEHKAERFIMISTDKAVNPTNVMGATKRMTEMILQAYGDNGVTKMAAVRFGNVLGSNGSVIPIFKEQIATGGPITLTSKEIIRYFMTIPEASQLVLQAGYYADQGEIFVLDMGEPVKILDLAENLIRLSGLRPYEDINIIEIGLRPGEKMFEELKLDGETTTKTKNNLIYKNEVMRISKEEVEDKLMILRHMLEQNASKEEFRKTMLEIIVRDKIEA